MRNQGSGHKGRVPGYPWTLGAPSGVLEVIGKVFQGPAGDAADGIDPGGEFAVISRPGLLCSLSMGELTQMLRAGDLREQF